jgi:hypothetical protein
MKHLWDRYYDQIRLGFRFWFLGWVQKVLHIMMVYGFLNLNPINNNSAVLRYNMCAVRKCSWEGDNEKKDWEALLQIT